MFDNFIAFFASEEFTSKWPNYGIAIGVILLSILIGIIGQFLLLKIIRQISRHTVTVLDNIILKYMKNPFRLLGPLFVISIVIPYTELPKEFIIWFQNINSSLFIISFSWIMIKLLSVFEDFIKHKYDMNVKDNLQSRKIHTQMHFIKRFISIVIILVAAAVILLQFKEISNLGTTLLASAGVVGIVIGFAAQRSIATIFAGFQIAFTQPIRIDDVVIVENEWGWIEEITLTYVVVRVWDLRRLILPITYFIEHPFQNWTRESADLLGTVFIYADYSIPVPKIRKKLQELVNNNPRWDKKVCNLQVTDAKEHTLELRCLVSAADGPALWDLRCEIREQLVDFIQKELPEYLPRTRAVLEKNTE
ncbi:MAG: mechanosensitive ion channel [Spirochaetales bacterium]|nr:mechanosensitive ion channel [Spirochaetales bacterium]